MGRSLYKKISKQHFETLKPIGIIRQRLHGLFMLHKPNTPIEPDLSLQKSFKFSFAIC